MDIRRQPQSLPQPGIQGPSRPAFVHPVHLFPPRLVYLPFWEAFLTIIGLKASVFTDRIVWCVRANRPH